VEEALMGHPAVLEVAVVGTPDEARGELVTAHVVLSESGAEAAAEDEEAVRHELQEHAKAQIAPYKYPRRIEFIEALPRTSTGKVQRYRLREAPSGVATEAAPQATP
jgi:2-aminobenzoate-CoA ligase